MDFNMYLSPIIIFLQIFMTTVNCASPFKVNEQGLYKVDEDCICPFIYKPVCASDGTTYPNSCVLTCTRRTNPYVIGLCNGECPCCSEPYYNDPLENIDIAGFWGWDTKTGTPHQVTVSNSGSELAEKDDEEKANNICSSSVASSDCVCYLLYAPVCGSDGKTYGNDCQLGCQAKVQPCLRQACEGECPCCPGQGPSGTCPEPASKSNSTDIAQ